MADTACAINHPENPGGVHIQSFLGRVGWHGGRMVRCRVQVRSWELGVWRNVSTVGIPCHTKQWLLAPHYLTQQYGTLNPKVWLTSNEIENMRKFSLASTTWVVHQMNAFNIALQLRKEKTILCVINSNNISFCSHAVYSSVVIKLIHCATSIPNNWSSREWLPQCLPKAFPSCGQSSSVIGEPGHPWTDVASRLVLENMTH